MKQFIIDNLFIQYKTSIGLNSSKLRYSWFKKYNFEPTYYEILNSTSFLPIASSLSERIYCILNDISNLSYCLYCDNRVKYAEFGVGYRRHCGNRKCSYLDKSLYKDESGLTPNEKTGKGISIKSKIIESNGNSKASNNGIKSSITKRNKIIDGKSMLNISAERASNSKYSKTINGINLHKLAARKAANTMNNLSINGKSIKDMRIEKMIATKSIIGEDGFDINERSFLNGAGRNSSIKYYNSILYYQGSYEKHFLDFMSDNGEFDKIKRGVRFKYIFENKNLIYRSDFIFNDNIIFEIKSDWTYGAYDIEKRKKNHIKFESVLSNNYKLFVILNKLYFIEVTKFNVNNNLYLEKTNLINIEKLFNYI